MPVHIPVMLHEVLEYLQPERGGPYWDLTLGAGGHLKAFLEAAPEHTRAFGLDGDPEAIKRCEHLPATLVHGPMAELTRIAQDNQWPAPTAVLLDVGLSSPQVDSADRGFSFRNDGPLDMRMDPTRGVTASQWLNEVTQDQLRDVLRELGGERFAGRIARTIKENLPIDTTDALTRAVFKALGGKRSPRNHPARRTFQAIRMAVNNELGNIESALSAAIDALKPGGRIAIISFHSGEDRVAKITFREQARAGKVTLLTKKPILCSETEADSNPRARSARLRCVEKN